MGGTAKYMHCWEGSRRQKDLLSLPDIVFAIQTEADLLQNESNLLCLGHGTKGFLHAGSLLEMPQAGEIIIPQQNKTAMLYDCSFQRTKLLPFGTAGQLPSLL